MATVALTSKAFALSVLCTFGLGSGRYANCKVTHRSELSFTDFVNFVAAVVYHFCLNLSKDGTYDKMNFGRIANATEGDAGVYACIVGTAEEHVRSVAHLAVEESAEYIATSVAREGGGHNSSESSAEAYDSIGVIHDECLQNLGLPPYVQTWDTLPILNSCNISYCIFFWATTTTPHCVYSIYECSLFSEIFGDMCKNSS